VKRECVVGFGVLVRDGMFEDEAEDVIVGDFGRLLAVMVPHGLPAARVGLGRSRSTDYLIFLIACHE